MILSRRVVYGVSIIAHIVLLIYGQWQDENLLVKYSDVDYDVFTDAASRLLSGASPFSRHTYRYTPLLAMLLIPNILLFHIFGKLLFSLIDLAAGLMIENILLLKNRSQLYVNYLLILWLWNPLVLQVSTRGNADTIPVLLVLLTISALLRKSFIVSGLLFGLSVHFKLYPVICGIPFLLSIHFNNTKTASLYHLFHLSKEQKQFFFSSIGIFFFLGIFFYYLYGYNFIYECYLYHFIRSDHRHNLSPIFYILYLTHLIPYLKNIVALGIFLPQWVPAMYLGCLYAKHDIIVSIFFQILCFVAFNKVCTVQYFLWWIGLLPLVVDACIHSLSSKNRQSFLWKTLCLIICWIATQGHWLYWGYQLEFRGHAVFLQICVASCLFLFSNIALLIHFMYAFSFAQTQKPYMHG